MSGASERKFDMKDDGEVPLSVMPDPDDGDDEDVVDLGIDIERVDVSSEGVVDVTEPGGEVLPWSGKFGCSTSLPAGSSSTAEDFLGFVKAFASSKMTDPDDPPAIVDGAVLAMIVAFAS